MSSPLVTILRRARRDIGRRHADESGIAMITVIAVSFILFIFATLVAAQSVNNIRQSRRQRVDEQSIHIADAGIDKTLFAIAQDPTYNTGHTVPLTFVDVAAEKAWAIATATPMTPTYSGDGEWVVIKPVNKAVVYSVGYSPTKVDATRIRVIRASFDSGASQTQYAILTHDDLVLGVNVKVMNTGGNVHTNGDLSGNASGSISGAATAVGTYSLPNMTVGANSGGGRPLVEVPDPAPRDYYADSEYDLCPDGTVRKGPAYPGGGNTSTTPCQGATLATATSKTYRGWMRTSVTSSKGAVWTMSTQGGYDGVYYIYQGSANITPKKLQHVDWTVIAEGTSSGTGPGGCPTVGGDIEMTSSGKSHHIGPSPSTSPLMYLAGRDLKIDAEWHPAMNSGVLLAHEQVHIGNEPVKLTGSLIAYDHCDTTGSPVNGNYIGAAEIRYGGYSIPPGIPRLYNWAEL